MKSDFKKLCLLLMLAALNGRAQWFTTGNTPTGTDYLGLNQPADLIFKTSATAGSPLERLRITSTGSIGIGNVTSPQHFMDISVPGGYLVGEKMFNIGVSDAGSDFFRIMTGTSANNQFMPLLVGHNNTNPAATGLYVCGSINSIYDLPVYSEPVINFNARRNFATSGGSAVSSRPLFCWSNYTTKYMTMLPNGFLGINTTAPVRKLHVNGDIYVTGQGADGNPTSASLFLGDDQTTPQFGMEYDGAGLNFWKPFGSNNFGNYFLYVKDNGKVGVHTNNPTADLTVNGNVLIGDPSSVTMPGDYKLYVQSGIMTEKIKVALASSSDWADYVFAKNYKLRSLQEVEAYIIEHKHLPNVPSADEISKEGLDVAKMDAKLLEKIEELTLYLIEQDKKINALESVIEKNKKIKNNISER